MVCRGGIFISRVAGINFLFITRGNNISSDPGTEIIAEE
jgi:hypothetical protein